MTVIAGLVANGTVYVGADSAGISGWSLISRADSKTFTNGPYALGFTSSFRMGQLLHHAFDPPKPPEHPDELEAFMVIRFVDAIRDCLKTGGWSKKDNEREAGGTFLVGVKSRLFRICDDYQVGENADGFDAVGAGHELALGALHASRDRKPMARVRLALEAAERFSASVRGPFTIVKAPR